MVDSTVFYKLHYFQLDLEYSLLRESIEELEEYLIPLINTISLSANEIKLRPYIHKDYLLSDKCKRNPIPLEDCEYDKDLLYLRIIIEQYLKIKIPLLKRKEKLDFIDTNRIPFKYYKDIIKQYADTLNNKLIEGKHISITGIGDFFIEYVKDNKFRSYIKRPIKKECLDKGIPYYSKLDELVHKENNEPYFAVKLEDEFYEYPLLLRYIPYIYKKVKYNFKLSKRNTGLSNKLNSIYLKNKDTNEKEFNKYFKRIKLKR